VNELEAGLQRDRPDLGRTFGREAGKNGVGGATVVTGPAVIRPLAARVGNDQASASSSDSNNRSTRRLRTIGWAVREPAPAEFPADFHKAAVDQLPAQGNAAQGVLSRSIPAAGRKAFV